MTRTIYRRSPLFLLLLLATLLPGAARAEGFVVWQAYNVKFEGEPSRLSLLASTYVLNPTHNDYRHLVFTAAAPEGFTLGLPPEEIQEASRRPEGFTEEIVDGSYRMTQPFLGAGQATTIFYRLTFDAPPPVDTTFPGIHIEYRSGDETKAFRAPDEINNTSRIRRFSGDISDFIKRYAEITLRLDGGEASDWTFTALDYRAFAQNPIGIIDIEGSPESSGHFRVQTGYPGTFREILVRWTPRSRGKKDPITREFARKELDSMIRWVGDFSLDEESLSVSDTKVARYPAVLISGRWIDNKPIRLGSGRFHFYVVHDPRDDRDFFLYLGVQGRGIGPERAKTPAPEAEEKLMEELVKYVKTFRP